MSKRKTITPALWSESILAEVRAIRQEGAAPSCLQDGNPTTGVQCSACGDFGDHVCLPELFEAIETDANCAEYCWRIYLELVNAGTFGEDNELG